MSAEYSHRVAVATARGGGGKAVGCDGEHNAPRLLPLLESPAVTVPIEAETDPGHAEVR